jgi:hypothetical protein
MATAAIFIFSPHNANAMPINKEHYSDFQTVIQGMGYSCNTFNGGRALGQGSRGMNFRAYCNDDSLSYFISWDFAGKRVCVETWSRKGTKCEE